MGLNLRRLVHRSGNAHSIQEEFFFDSLPHSLRDEWSASVSRFLCHALSTPLEPVFAPMVAVMNGHRGKDPYVLSSCAQQSVRNKVVSPDCFADVNVSLQVVLEGSVVDSALCVNKVWLDSCDVKRVLTGRFFFVSKSFQNLH